MRFRSSSGTNEVYIPPSFLDMLARRAMNTGRMYNIRQPQRVNPRIRLARTLFSNFNSESRVHWEQYDLFTAAICCTLVVATIMYVTQNVLFIGFAGPLMVLAFLTAVYYYYTLVAARTHSVVTPRYRTTHSLKKNAKSFLFRCWNRRYNTLFDLVTYLLLIYLTTG